MTWRPTLCHHGKLMKKEVNGTGLFKKIKDAFTGEELMHDLCAHLQALGIHATLLASGSPDAIGPRWKKGPFISESVLGNIKIDGHNLDLLVVGRRSEGGGEDTSGGIVHPYFYVVRAPVEGLEKRLDAKSKSIRKGFFSKDVTDLQWEGGDLAQQLNADADLKAMILSTGLVGLEVRPDKTNRCVRILGYPGLPSREHFDLYDRIAHYIRIITGPRPR